MKTYKQCKKISLGCSDVASLILAGCTNHGVVSDCLRFGQDGLYSAYLITENISVPDHYDLDVSYNHWLRVYDDTGLTRTIYADKIDVYTAGDFGCIIKVKNLQAIV